VLQKAGLDIGRDLYGPGPGNPRGHFEDRDFFHLHEDMLAAAGESWCTVGDDFAPPKDPEFERRARWLIAEREALPLWGWKDPRTSLFLDFWDAILPEARYLFLYRHPVDVVLSLWRRNTDREIWRKPWLAVRVWEIYTRRLLEFRDRNPHRCFLAQVPALTIDFAGLIQRLREKLDLPLRNGGDASLFAPEELMPHRSGNLDWPKLIPEALDLYQRLERSADLPAQEEAAPEDRQPPRERDLHHTCERLLYALLENRTEGISRECLEASLTKELERVSGLTSALARELRGRQQIEADLDEERRRAAALVAGLREEQKRSARAEADLREEQARSARAEADLATVTRVLAQIESSRTFAPVRAWWRLRQRLGKRQTSRKLHP
jgi:hypothetical protein